MLSKGRNHLILFGIHNCDNRTVILDLGFGPESLEGCI